MSDPLTWSPISLGRWFGTAVRVHVLLIVFLAARLLAALVGPAPGGRLANLSQTACWLGLLVVALALHELGHAVAAAWLDGEPETVHVWPLGNLVGPSFSLRSGENYLVALAGLLVSGALFLATAAGLSLFAGAHVIWWPFGNGKPDFGAPWVGQDLLASPFTGAWVLGWFAYWNWVLFLVNLIPALPFDGGRALRCYLGSTSAVASRDNSVAFWLARGFAIIVAFGGLLRLLMSWGAEGWTLIAIAFVIEYMVRIEARMLEEGGFFDDGIFGYDFSEGYTSLEGAAAVRPRRENALKRWRRRRSELRRQRRMAREAAEERRMDEILEKLYREGRGALSEEENRFLVRVSARYRNRTKNT